jgi:gliotoxin/aspirochlorine biosynthesis thioredoxin reductase
MEIYDALILGAGPGGLASALALARVHRTAAVFSTEQFRNDGITAMHTVPSRDHFHPAEFRAISKSQILERYSGIEFHDTEIVKASKTVTAAGYDGFQVVDHKGREWTGRKLVLATGSKDIFPPVEGYAENWPHNM